MEQSPSLPVGFTLRPAQWLDLEPVTRLIYDVLAVDDDTVLAVSADDLRAEWETPDFDLSRDAWVVTAPDGRVIGFEEFNSRDGHFSLQGDGYVHPDFMGLGVGTALLRALETRAREEIPLAAPDLRVFIRNGMAMSPADAVARQMHENEGYTAIRYHWRMQIDLTAAPPEPALPEGVELRPFLADQHSPSVYEAEQEAFLDHWGSRRIPFEAWHHRKVARQDFDPTLWHVAWAGDEIAGFSQCRWRNDTGWVSTLGVRRPWRKHGLGLALLLRSFGEFHRRGMNTIGLGVDAQNPTGATRLYQKAGMNVAAEYVMYEKTLRAGRDMEEEEM
ncbi:MAG: Mycothiol acetyltransferase [Anaerolineales bacterium]|nr:Mycothiol acetyltransferase [Anaerolineales bacterium]